MYTFYFVSPNNKGKVEPLSYQDFVKITKHEAVKKICDEIRSVLNDGSLTDGEKHEKKSAVKAKVPAMTMQGIFATDRRVASEAVSNGMVMLDIDDIDANEWWKTLHEEHEGNIQEWLDANRIAIVHRTPGGGLRIVGELMDGETIEEGQHRLASAAGVSKWDTCTKDLARMSYIVPNDYYYFINPNSFEGDEKNFKINNKQIMDKKIETDCFYDGINCKEIIEAVIASKGGEPEEGKRHNMYYAVALQGRYLVEYNPDRLLSIMPSWGLPEDERIAICTDVCKFEKRRKVSNLTKELKEVIASLRYDKAADSGIVNKMVDVALPTHIPQPIKLILSKVPEKFHAAGIIGMLPALGTLLTDVSSTYIDGSKQRMNFMSIILGTQASGKSFIKPGNELLLTPLREHDAIELAKREEYQKSLALAKNQKTQPAKQTFALRLRAFNATDAGLQQSIVNCKGKHIYSFCEELGMITHDKRLNSDKKEYFLLAFDNGEAGQQRLSETAFDGLVKVAWNWLALSTPAALRDFLIDGSFSNGLATRLAIAEIPYEIGEEIPVYKKYTEEEKTFIVESARRLTQYNGEVTVPYVTNCISEWIKGKQQESKSTNDVAIDTLLKRSAVMGFRAGIIAYLLWNEEHPIWAAEFAEYVAEYIFQVQYKLFAQKIITEYKQSLPGFSLYKNSAQKLLLELPETFTYDDYLRIRVKNGFSTKDCRKSLSNWVKKNLLIKTGKTYAKVM